jgi:hypothetical protein
LPKGGIMPLFDKEGEGRFYDFNVHPIMRPLITGIYGTGREI